MTLAPSDVRQLVDTASQAASEAGRMIAQSRPRDIERKAGAASLASQVVTEIDRRSERLILERLAPTIERFDLGLLTEEQDDDGSRFTADYFWCIDPLDGTLPFVEGTPGYAVSIALVGRDGTPWLGVVYDPVQDSLMWATRGGGAFRDGVSWPTEPLTGGEALSVFADRSFLERSDHDAVVGLLDDVAHDMGLDGVLLHVSSGAVMNAVGVLDYPPACYFKHPTPHGGGSLWDFAATACLFSELGASATDIDGMPLDLNRAGSTSMNHRGVVFATDGLLADRIVGIPHDRS